MQKPHTVSTAVNFLWTSLAVHLVSTLMKYFGAGGVLALDTSTLTIVFQIAISAFLIFRIATGKNWARIVYSVLFVTDVIMLSFMLVTLWQFLLINILLMTEAGLQAYALFLLFTQPARSWFLRKWRGNHNIMNKE